VLSHDDAVRWAVKLVPDGTGAAVRDAVAEWLTRHRRLLSAGVSVGIAGVLIASPVVPRLVLPLVIGPTVAVVLTALITPDDRRRRS
jgi:hypothetical protein